MNFVDFLLNVIVNFTCTFTGIWVLSHCMERKHHLFVIRCIIAGILSISQTFVSLLGIPLLNTLSLFIMIIGFTLICFDCKKFIFLLYDTLIIVATFAADLISTLSLSVISSSTIQSVLQQQNMTVARYILTCVLTFIFCNTAFLFVNKKYTETPWYEIIFYLMLTAGEVLSVSYIERNIQASSSGMFIITFLVGCFILDIYVVLVFYRLSRVKKSEHENALLQQQSKLQLSLYHGLQDRYDHSMRVIHDVKKHITALEGLIEAEHTQKACHYKNALYQELDKLHTSFHSENQLLSVIINHALQKAEQKNICIKLHIEPLTLDFLSDIDMTTIISNILDNALETVENLPDDQKVIWFFIEKRMGCVIIHSENAFHYVHCEKNKKYISTKSGHMGLGLTNTENAVRKYNGIFSTSVENDKFIVSITIPERS